VRRVCFIGQRFWAERLAGLVNEHAGGSPLRASFVDGGNARAVLGSHGLFGSADLFVRVGFRPGSPTRRGVLFDALWRASRMVRRSARRAYLWIGTDVFSTLADTRAGSLSPFFAAERDGPAHWTTAPWLLEELAGVGIQAEMVRFPDRSLAAPASEGLPAEFRVLSYIPDQRFAFYGGPTIQAVAERLPSVPFDVVGGRGGWAAGGPTNLVFHGWQADLVPFYDRSTLVVRMVEHDAIGGSVREGLAMARHVAYSYPLPHTHHVRFGDAASLVEIVESLADRHRAGALEPNVAGREFMRREFDAATLSRHLIEKCLNLIG